MNRAHPEKLQERTLVELCTDLAEQSQALVHQEIQLLRVEAEAKIDKLSRSLAYLLGGGVAIYTGVLVLLSACVTALATQIQLWQASLAIGSLVCLLGAFFVGIGSWRLRRPKPRGGEHERQSE